ncbi:MAG: hypothetical protein H7842_04915 [Gammaproteobacteria bacterium SHHR-1]|uniref:hypothetical protein n=1 Tax=Magnetovirga frankeli TaxID=947516 RepID=UPI001293ABA9|nr:hypothetical protein D5125_13360 [gamma proteobacterium SS-5]
MPYFVYQITEPRQLELLQQFDSYKQARELARGKRAELGVNSAIQVRMIFARNNAEAEKLLSTPREERYIDEG